MTDLNTIPTPTVAKEDPRRSEQCRQALEPSYEALLNDGSEDPAATAAGRMSDLMMALANRAQASGWATAEADTAIAALAAAHANRAEADGARMRPA